MKTTFLPAHRCTGIAVACLALIGLLAAPAAQALELPTAYERALQFDAAYQASLAQRDRDRLSINQARFSYLPQAAINSSAFSKANADGSKTSTTVTVTQPIISLDRAFHTLQASPLEEQSQAEWLLQRQALAQRVLEGSTRLIQANENLRLSAVKIQSLQQQSTRATEMRRGGLGTVTDERDIEVRLSQAQAERLNLLNQLDNARQRYASLTGQLPESSRFVLPAQHASIPLLTVFEYLDQALQNNPGMKKSRAGLRVSDLQVKRAKSVFAPTLVATAGYQRDKGGDSNDSSVTLTLNVPLGYSTVADLQGAGLGLRQADLALRSTEIDLRLNMQNAVNALQSGNQMLDIQTKAIQAAQLSVEATQLSNQGGVRTSGDVLNAIQTLYQVQKDYVDLAVARASNHLSLLMLLGTDGDEAMSQVQAVLMPK
jgi:outer membrane protein TolC